MIVFVDESDVVSSLGKTDGRREVNDTGTGNDKIYRYICHEYLMCKTLTKNAELFYS